MPRTPETQTPQTPPSLKEALAQKPRNQSPDILLLCLISAQLTCQHPSHLNQSTLLHPTLLLRQRLQLPHRFTEGRPPHR
eukprot:CAMPEP_0204465752 /NCGR_PEP_ID=MMETSP0471-20130131/8604_1 /ASSEMBLY_ACC=CAM_ASM_000602 /TAXON_ID=2969 /ORGANISM="Oxyrrhis marina" /LENGTH=79 /DNA_ID=CAMNT_0051467315 /DNA_START=76 /DNA_END=311 /DNA_ORIENTATION=+